MDWLIDAAPQIEREVFWSVASLLDLEVDLLFFDTTSTYFETEHADEGVARDARGEVLPDSQQPPAAEDTVADDGDGPTRVGFRTWGKSKDSRGDLPQIVIGMAVTRTGIPVRVWSWPNAVAFTVAEAGSLEQSRHGVALQPFPASWSDTPLRAA